MRVILVTSSALILVLITIAVVRSEPSTTGFDKEQLQKLFDLSVEKKRLEFDLHRLDKRMAEIEKRQFAGADRVATPLSSDYWESISDTVLYAKASQDIRADEVLLYHAPGIYRLGDIRPTIATNGECWYFVTDRAIKAGEEFTIVPSDGDTIVSREPARDPVHALRVRIEIPRPVRK